MFIFYQHLSWVNLSLKLGKKENLFKLNSKERQIPNMSKYQEDAPMLGIFRTLNAKANEEYYIASCEELGIPYKIIDIWSSSWIEQIRESGCRGFLVRPPCDFQERKTGYDERLWFLSSYMGYPIYPTYDECLLYENKRAVAYWLALQGFPGIPTKIFYRKDEALEYFKSAVYPLIIKSNVGSAASGVKVLKSFPEARKYLNGAFGLFSQHFATGWWPDFKFRGKITLPQISASQRHYLLVQPFFNIKWEWRVTKIGNSYFGKQKLLKGKFASGSKLFGWIPPPREVLDLVRNICERGNFSSMAVDILETVEGKYYVNELQSLFGSYHSAQLFVDGKPGRYLWNGSGYEFQEGHFNRHGSCLLRVEHFLKMLREDSYWTGNNNKPVLTDILQQA